MCGEILCGVNHVQKINCYSFICLVFKLLAFSPTIKSIAAENPIKTTCAIDWIPKATTAFGIMLKNKEQLDLILNSKAYKKLTELGGTKMLIEKFNEGYTGNLKEGEKDQFNQILAAMGELFRMKWLLQLAPTLLNHWVQFLVL